MIQIVKVSINFCDKDEYLQGKQVQQSVLYSFKFALGTIGRKFDIKYLYENFLVRYTTLS